MPLQHFELRNVFPTLKTVGVAAQSFRGYVNPGRGPFTHDVLYCSLITRGHATHRVAEARYPERVGSLSVVGYGVPHEILTGKRGVDHCNLYLDPARHPMPRLSPELDRALFVALPLHPALVHRPNRLTRVTVLDHARLASYLRAIEVEQESTAPGRDTGMSALLQLVLLEIARGVPETPEPLSTEEGNDDEMEQVRRELEARFTEAWSMARLAATLRVTPEHFSRRFKRYAGCSPMAYLKSRRLHAAMAQLRSTDAPIVRVAAESGFSDLAHFNRAFRATTGMRPREYRDRSRRDR